MHKPYNPQMENDDRKFHDEEIGPDRILQSPTPLAPWLNMLLSEFEGLFKQQEMEFDEQNGFQLKGFISKLSENLTNDIADKVEPVGTLVYSSVSLEQFQAQKVKGQLWLKADGSPAPEDSKFFSAGFGFSNDKDPDDKSRYLPDARRYLRAPESQNDLNLNKGLLEDAVNPSGVSATGGKVTTKVGFSNADIKQEKVSVDILFRYAKRNSRISGNDLRWSADANEVLAQHAGNRLPVGLYGEGDDEQVYSQRSIFDATRRNEKPGHSHNLDISGKDFTGNIDEIQLSGASETRPKTQLINAFVRVN